MISEEYHNRGLFFINITNESCESREVLFLPAPTFSKLQLVGLISSSTALGHVVNENDVSCSGCLPVAK